MDTGKLLGLCFLVLNACGSSVDGGDRPPQAISCEGGTLRVRGDEITEVRAEYPPASPPERLLAFSTSPGTWISSELDWTAFHLYEPTRVVTITTTDVATGEKLCPLWAEALP
jgi:hypothetical protein